MTAISTGICRLLEKNTAAGRRIGYVFEDWLDMSTATLRMLPAHLKSVQETGQMAEDDAETKALWERLRQNYNPRPASGYFANFKEAFHLMLAEADKSLYSDSWSEGGGPDVVGWVYMELDQGGWNGQFFTPWPVAKIMADLTIKQGPALVLSRLRQAFDRAVAAADPIDEAVLFASLLTGGMADTGNGLGWFIARVWPLLRPYYEPLTVYDPACGSGIMLLAAASQFPAWMIALGLVQFWGQDIDRLCVKMAQLNCMLYNLNQAPALALPAPLLTPRPAPLPSLVPLPVPALPDPAQPLMQLSLF